MYLKYGSYTHELQEARFAISRPPVVDNGGNTTGYKERWDISGELRVDDHSQMTAAIQALEAAYASGGSDLILYDFDGVTQTAHKLISANTVGGTKIVQPVHYPKGDGAQYSTFRYYEVSVEAEIRSTSAGTRITLDFAESLVFKGGGPEVKWITLRNGPPQPQTVSQVTPQYVTQSGSAMGYGSWPSPPGPIFGQNELRDKRVVGYASPQLTGEGANRRYINYETTWTYEFASGTPLSGYPNRSF